jgi:hypothetical protein
VEREREGKGKGKGKGKERESEGHFFNFYSFGSFRNGFETLKQPKQTERGGYILSEKIPNRTETASVSVCFGSNRKKKKSVSQDTLMRTPLK